MSYLDDLTVECLKQVQAADAVLAQARERRNQLVRYQVNQLRMLVAELIERRQARGVSQAALSRMTGLRRNTISEVESGQSYLDWSTLARLAWALDADLRFVGRWPQRAEPVPPRS